MMGKINMCRDNKLRIYKILIVAFFAGFLLSMSAVLRAFATTNLIGVQNAEITKSSEGVEGEIVSFSGDSIVSQVKFHHLDDYVEYTITLKNNDLKEHIIESISDNDENDYVDYSYDQHEDFHIKPGETFDFIVTAKYVNAVSNIDERILDSDVDFKIKYLTTEETDTIPLIPNTGKGPQSAGDVVEEQAGMLVITAIILAVCIVIVVKRKSKVAKLVVVMVAAISTSIVAVNVRAISRSEETFNFKAQYYLYDKIVVNYDVKGAKNSLILDYGTKLSETELVTGGDPVNESYEFKGWFLEDGNKINVNDPITSDITLKAEWLIPPTISLLNEGDYYIGTDNKILATTTYNTKSANVKYVYKAVNSDEENAISNTDEIAELGDYIVTATITDEDNLTASDSKQITITGPTLDFAFDDNKEYRHYWNKSIKFISDITDNEVAISDVKYYVARGEDATTTDGMGNSGTVKIDYYDEAYSINNLLGLPIGHYKIKMVVTDENSIEFEKEKEIQITYGSFDFAKGFTYTDPQGNKVITKTNVQSVKFVDGLGDLDLETATNYQDISADGDGGVIEWWEKDENTGLYDIYIGGQYSHYVQSSGSSIKNLLSGYTKLKTVDFEYLYTGNLINMSYLFDGDTALTTINWGSHWDTSNVIDISYMFNNCKSITYLNLNGWDTGRVKTMPYVFANMSNLEEIHIEDWNTGSLERITAGFLNDHKLTSLDLNKWDVRNLRGLDGAFMMLSNLTELKVSNWQTDSLADLGFTFRGLPKIKELDLSNWNFSKVTQIHRVFSDDVNLERVITNNPIVLRENGGSLMFGYAFTDCRKLSIELTIYATSVGNESTMYGKNYALANAATANDANIIIHYNNASKTVFNKMYATRSSSSHITGINDDLVNGD